MKVDGTIVPTYNPRRASFDFRVCFFVQANNCLKTIALRCPPSRNADGRTRGTSRSVGDGLEELGRYCGWCSGNNCSDSRTHDDGELHSPLRRPTLATGLDTGNWGGSRCGSGYEISDVGW